MDSERWAKLNSQLLGILPLENQCTIRYLCAYLKVFAKTADIHKMNLNNLAIVFGPNFMRPLEETMETAVKDMPIANTFISALITNAEDWIAPPKKKS